MWQLFNIENSPLGPDVGHIIDQLLWDGWKKCGDKVLPDKPD